MLKNKEQRKVYYAGYCKKHKEELKEKRHNYYLANKNNLLQYMKKYRKINREVILQSKLEYRQQNRQILNTKQKKYAKTEKGKQVKARVQARRIRKLDWVPVFENPFDEEVEWHHVDDIHVIALPTDLHKLYMGNFHRENLEYIIKQLYKEF